MFEILKMWAQAGIMTEKISVASDLINSFDIDSFIKENDFSKDDLKALSRSLLIRHLDAGSSNAEEAEMLALSNSIYDITRFGIDITVSPRHADVLTVSGPVTRHLKIAMERTYHAMPDPKVVVAIGDGACNGSIYEKTYANLGRVDQFLPVDLYIPGDPPTPREIIQGLLLCKILLAKKKSSK